MFTVTLDACVLVPITLADHILRAAQEQIFSVRWSPKILEETKHAMMRLGVEDQAASRRIGHMQCAFPFASTDITSAHRPPMTHDEKDWHVAAAALAADSHTIVTFNLKDFAPEHLNPLGLNAIHPDDFLLDQLDLAPGRMMRALTAQSAATRNPLQHAIRAETWTRFSALWAVLACLDLLMKREGISPESRTASACGLLLLRLPA